jgi:photosystem II protein PsbQ
MKRTRFKAIVAVVLALFASFWVQTASYAAKAKPPKYTAAQIEQVQRYAASAAELQNRLDELQTLIDQENWTFVRNLLRGPYGELRTITGRVVRNLQGPDRKAAQQAEDRLFKDLVSLDAAALEQNYEQAVKSYSAVVKDWDAFLSLVPNLAS